MISFREADLLERMQPTKMLVRFKVVDRNIELKWLGPVNERYSEEVWERIKYLKKALPKMIDIMSRNLGIANTFLDKFNYVVRLLKEDKRISEVKELSFDAPDPEVEVTIK